LEIEYFLLAGGECAYGAEFGIWCLGFVIY